MNVDIDKELEKKKAELQEKAMLEEKASMLETKVKEQEKQHKKELELIKKELKSKAKNVQVVKKDISTKYEDFKAEEKSKWYNPISWWKTDKTNPMVMIIVSPAGDLTIRERVADQRGNLSLGRHTLYRIEHKSIYDIADSDIKGFSGKKVLFYFQDVPNPLLFRRDDTKSKVTVNTETYAKSQKTHILSELLAPELKFSDYISMIMLGINIVLSLVIIVKVFFVGGGATP